jgi:cell division protein FtsN
MKFFKGILKYSVYMFIAAWMFLLGIMVGRGTSPVKFDTQKFQKRLEIIADDFGAQKKIPDKIDLKFYDVLDRPELEELVAHKKNVVNNGEKEILPAKENVTDSIPLKTSKKKQTFKKEKIKEISEYKPAQKSAPKQNSESKTENSNNQPNKPKVIKGKYIVQIAAYKDFTDAVSQMAVLQKKGFSSYRVKGQTDGVTWYRVRSGPFISFEEAKKFKKKLEKIKINSLIIKSG